VHTPWLVARICGGRTGPLTARKPLVVDRAAMSSHRSMSPEERESVGIRDNLLRVSVGIEDPQDILADLDRALEVAARV
jgi:cystathionine gamma-synthase